MEPRSFSRPHFVVNARPREASAGAALASLRAAIQRAWSRAGWSATAGPGDATALARAAAAGGADLVVAVGGDGTINEVVNGLLTADPVSEAGNAPPMPSGPAATSNLGRQTGARPTLGILPFGSGSDFARSLGLPRDVGAALSVLRDGRSRIIDVGKIVCAPLEAASAAAATTRYFVNMGGCGTSARVAQRFNERRIPGRLGYAAAAALTTLDYRWPVVDIRTDDGEARTVSLNMFFACNGEYCGGGMRAGRGARLDDGTLLVIEATGVSRLRTVLEWPRLYRGRLAGVRGISVTAARRIHITSAEDALVDCDGEICGRLPATYTVVPGALTVRVP